MMDNWEEWEEYAGLNGLDVEDTDAYGDWADDVHDSRRLDQWYRGGC